MARILLGITDRISARGQVIVTSVALLCVSLFLTAYSSKHPEVARVGSVIASEAFTPLHAVLAAARDSASTVWNHYVYLRGVSRENEVLREQLNRLQGDLAGVGEIAQENVRLRELLKFSSESGIEGLPARVIGSDPTGWVHGLLINQGTSSGVEAGMAVVSAQGVVGQVVAAGPNSARVLLITDSVSGVDAVVQGSRARGVVEGVGSKLCELRYVTKDTPVNPGEKVVTSGLDRVYPKGLVLGTVSTVQAGGEGLFQTVSLQPAVDVRRVEEVLVLNRNRGGGAQ